LTTHVRVWQTKHFPKLERLRVIGRVVHLHTVSYGKVKRFKTWQGKTPAWVIEFIDPLARMAGAGCFWALRGDEYAIVKQWQAYLSRIIFPTDLRCTDGGASVMEGRFRRRYSRQGKVRKCNPRRHSSYQECWI